MAQLRSITDETSLRRAAAHPRAWVARDLAADWRRWSLPEHIIAVALVATVVLIELALSTAMAGGH